MKCISCDSISIKKDGFRKTQQGDFQRYKCKECDYNFTLDQKFIKQKRKKSKLNLAAIKFLQDEKNLSLRQIAKHEKIALSTLQYFLKQNEK